MKYYLEILVFIIGAIVMIFEIVGSRLLAPDFGTSIIVWTNLIGIILGSLSLGYYMGGKMADYRPSLTKLSLLVFLSAVGILIPFLLKDIFVYFSTNIISDIKYSALVVSIFLFAPGSIFLGTINPYAIKLKLSSLATGGQVVGKMSALGTLGSIAGTFMAGFYFVPYFGSNNVIWFIIAFLMIISIVLGTKSMFKAKLALFFLIILLFVFEPFKVESKFLIERIETHYNTISIEEGKINSRNEGPLRTLSTDPYGIHGACLVNDCDKLIFETLEAFFLGPFLRPDFTRTLMIGGGTYSFPKEFAKIYPNAHLDVVEIDPGFTEVAKKYFNWLEPPNISVVHEDGRTYLNKYSDEEYNIIFLDAFNSKVSIPFHLTTQEAVELLYKNLDESGLVVVNIIASLEGETAKFLQAEHATYKKYFPYVSFFPIQFKDSDKVQNIMMVASKQEIVLNNTDPQAKKIFSHLHKGQIKEGIILRDNFAPVEFMNFEMVNKL
jgi:spermidine synthase